MKAGRTERWLYITLLIVAAIDFALFLYSLYLHRRINHLKQLSFYYLNKSLAAENDLLGLSYLLVRAGIHVDTVFAILDQHPEVESFVPVVPEGEMRKSGWVLNLMAVDLLFDTSGNLKVIVFRPIIDTGYFYPVKQDTLIIYRCNMPDALVCASN